jgi:hypothetical protein
MGKLKIFSFKAACVHDSLHALTGQIPIIINHIVVAENVYAIFPEKLRILRSIFALEFPVTQ